LVFSASVAGQLVPCGCSPDQRGGLPREVSLVKKLREKSPGLIFIDAGDLLFESPQRPPPQLLTQKQLKARTLARGDELLGTAARALGERDLSLGPQFALETAGKVPLLDAGVAPAPGARASLVVNGVGIFAAGHEENPAATIAARAKGLREQGARLVVLLLHPRGDAAFTAAQALVPAARAAGVDLIVLGHRDDPAVDPDRKDPSQPPLLAVEGHGQSLLRVDVQLGAGPVALAPSDEDRQSESKALDARIERFRAQAELYPERKQQLEAKIAELEERKRALAKAPVQAPAKGSSVAVATFLPLTAEAGEDPEAKKLVDAYDAKVTELNLAEAKTQPPACPQPAKGEPAYVGVNGCVECHKPAAEFWQETRHSRAYATLVNVNKQFSLDCIRCHVTGWQQPGGVCRIDRTEFLGAGLNGHGVGRRDVQCEACHGPGSEHVKDPPEHIQAQVTPPMCMRCHEAANSPHFDYAKYRPYIVGPGHGMPLAKGEKPHPSREGSPLN
jgi:nitrate reductase cytochrome c-type subunit